MNAPVNPDTQTNSTVVWVYIVSGFFAVSAMLNFFRFVPSPNVVANYHPSLFWLSFAMAFLVFHFGMKPSFAPPAPEPRATLLLRKAGHAALYHIFVLPFVSIIWVGVYTFLVFVGPLVSTFVHSEPMRIELTIERKSSSNKCRRELSFAELGFWGGHLCGVDQDIWSKARVCDRVAAIGVGNGLGMRVKKLDLLQVGLQPADQNQASEC